MTKQGDFLIYCIEIYKSSKNLTGKQVSDLFSRFDVWNYIYTFYQALHTTGANYIVEDIDQYIKVQQSEKV